MNVIIACVALGSSRRHGCGPCLSSVGFDKPHALRPEANLRKGWVTRSGGARIIAFAVAGRALQLVTQSSEYARSERKAKPQSGDYAEVLLPMA